MNYKSMLKGALALSLGLIVGSASAATTTTSDVPLYGATFESATSAVEPLNDFAYATNTLVTTYTATEGGATYGWLGAAEDESKIIAANGGQALQLNTDAGTLTNLLAPTAVAAPLNTAIAGAGVYIETEAKFVASDTLDAGVRGGTDNTKFAIYAYADENANPCTTNLVVYHGVMDALGAITYTNEVFSSIDIDVEEYTAVRVEMKQLEDPQSPGDIYNVFSISIGGGDALSSELALDKLFDPNAAGTWFLTVENRGNDDNKLLSSVNFKGTGEVDNLEVGTITATTTYAIDWSASRNVIASNLTANAQLAAGETNFVDAVQLAFYPTEGNVITNVLLNGTQIDGVMFPIDSYSYTVSATDATLTILAGEQAAPPAPTVITVAQTVGAHGGSISNGNFQAVAGVATPITITADQGYVIAQIVLNGTPVANALGETSVTFDAVFSDAEGANNSIVATFAKDNAWFLDPFIRTKTVSLGTCNNTFLASISPDENYFFVGNSPSAHAAAGAEIINVPGFINSLNPEYAPVAKATGPDVSNKALRGGAASTDLQLGIAGSLAANENTIIPFDGSAPYQVTHSIGAALDALDFSANSAYLYAGCYTSGFRSKIYKLSFANNLAEGDTLTVEATYDVASAGIARVRAICVETINGNEYVYVAGGDDTFQGVAVIDTTTGTVTRLLDVTLSGQTNQPMSIDVAGIADGTPRLYIGFFGSFTKIYAMTADGVGVISTEPITTIPSSVLASPSTANLFSLDGETNALACANVGSTTRAYVLEKKPANLIVRGVINQGAADDRSVAFGAAAEETFTAPVGETLISVKVNGVSQQIAEGATSFTYEAAELTQYVYIDMQSVEPQYTATYTGSENVIVTNTYDGSSYQWGEGEEVVPTQIACLSGTVLSFYPTEGNVITNVTIGGVEQTGFDPACYSITVISDTNLVVLAGVQTSPATVISVAKLSDTAVMVGDAVPRFTATVTDSNGDAVDPSDYAIDASAIDTTTAGLYPVVITAAAPLEGVLTNYFAVMNLTWFNGTPTQKAVINPPFDMNKIHYMHRSQDDVYLAVHGGNGSDGGSDSLFSMATLKGLYGLCSSNWEVAGNHGSINYGSKGAAVNTVKNIMVLGRGVNYLNNPVRVYDISSFNGKEFISTNNYTTVWTGSGYDVQGSFEPDVRMDGIDFSHDGSYIFGNNAGAVSAANGGPFGGDGPWVYQLAVDTNAKTLSWVATYTSDFARVRSVSSYYIDNKDYVFIGEGASSGKGEIAVIDPSDGSVTTICAAGDDFTTAEFPSGRYFTNVKVSGIGTGEMYLYGSTDSGEVVIWALGHDAVTGEWKTAPVGNITSAKTQELVGKSGSNSRAFEVSNDNTTGFLYIQASDGQLAVVTDISLAQRKALASATLTPAGSDKDVALGAITATVLDENGDTVAAAEYTITTNLIDIATVGTYTVTITPVEGSIYSNAVTAVYTISEPSAQGYNYPEGGAIEDAAVVAWLSAKGFTQAQVTALSTNAKLNECYLLNCDITQANAGGSIAITGIEVGADGVVITVALTRTGGYEGGINGTLALYGASDLTAGFSRGAIESVTLNNGKFTSGNTATATFTGTGKTFFKAFIDRPVSE